MILEYCRSDYERVVRMVENMFSFENLYNLVETINYLMEQYYSNLSYIKNDYTTAINYMNIAINAKTSYDAGYKNISAENLATIIADAKNAIAKVNLTSGDYNKVQVKEFEELKAKFEALVK